jgi:ribosomal protein L35AE/L33A
MEQDVTDFGSWKQVFDADPAHRKESGVRSYRIGRRTDDPNHVVMDLDFENTGDAQAFLTKLQDDVWQSPAAMKVMSGGTPQAEIIETIEAKTL